MHVLHPEHAELALRFATRGAHKFSDAGLVANGAGLPVLPRACVTLTCDVEARHPGGDHTILLGRVTAARVLDETPAVYFRREFHVLDG